MYIFLDESGDLGFDFDNKKPSHKFVITLLICHSKDAVDAFRTAVRRTLKNKLNHKKANQRYVEELHGADLALSYKEYFYRQVKSTEWCIYTIALNKKRVFDHLTSRQGRKKLYNYLSRFLLDKIDLSAVGMAVTLVVDKSKNKADIADFNSYLGNQLEARLPLNVPLNITHEDSKANTGLQAVDLFCWGIYRKYEHGDRGWYQRYASRIAFETEYMGSEQP